MQQTWRWFGFEDDPISLEKVRQAGATGVVTALHQDNRGEVWPADEIEKRRDMIRAVGLEWTVAESIGVREEMKTRASDFLRKIDKYKQSIRKRGAGRRENLLVQLHGHHGLSRTNLMWRLPNGGYALRFEAVDFAAYDLFILEREGAKAHYPPARQTD